MENSTHYTMPCKQHFDASRNTLHLYGLNYSDLTLCFLQGGVIEINLTFIAKRLQSEDCTVGIHGGCLTKKYSALLLTFHTQFYFVLRLL